MAMAHRKTDTRNSDRLMTQSFWVNNGSQTQKIKEHTCCNDIFIVIIRIIRHRVFATYTISRSKKLESNTTNKSRFVGEHLGRFDGEVLEVRVGDPRLIPAAASCGDIGNGRPLDPLELLGTESGDIGNGPAFRGDDRGVACASTVAGVESIAEEPP